jgi:A/G-specific adenine glycosylase
MRENVKEKETNARLWELARELVSCAAQIPSNNSRMGNCSALNQSLMELGATACSPRQPECPVCPLASRCIAHKLGLTETTPNLGKRTTTTRRRFLACVIEHNGAVLVRQRPRGVVNAHLWEFPNVEVPLGLSQRGCRERLESELGCTLDHVSPLTTVKHTITRYRITLQAFRGELNGRMPRPSAGEWIPKGELTKLAFNSAHRRLLASALEAENDSRTSAAH